MASLAIGGIVFVCVFGGALLGSYVRILLPREHLSTDSKDVVKLGMGLIGTMAALVLGLLISSAKGSYDTRAAAVAQMGAEVNLLNRLLVHYGPEAGEARALLRRGVANALDEIWPSERSRDTVLAPTGESEALYEVLHHLSPRDDVHRALQTDALAFAVSLARTRWMLAAKQGGEAIPRPFLVVLVLWLAVILASFGLFAPRNGTVIAALFVCALSFSSAVFLILELDQAFRGFVKISSAPIREALERLDR